MEKSQKQYRNALSVELLSLSNPLCFIASLSRLWSLSKCLCIPNQGFVFVWASMAPKAPRLWIVYDMCTCPWNTLSSVCTGVLYANFLKNLPALSLSLSSLLRYHLYTPLFDPSLFVWCFCAKTANQWGTCLSRHFFPSPIIAWSHPEQASYKQNATTKITFILESTKQFFILQKYHSNHSVVEVSWRPNFWKTNVGICVQ